MEAETAATPSLNWQSLLALNYDLLLQYPVHRLAGNAKIERKLSIESDAALVAEETLINDAFDLIESLVNRLQTDTGPNDDAAVPERETQRLQRLLPLLLYRYRPITEQVNVSDGSSGVHDKENDNDDVGDDGDDVAPKKSDGSKNDVGPTVAQKDSEMAIVRDRQKMKILAFNFRPFNTGLRYNDWPLGRTKEVVIATGKDGDVNVDGENPMQELDEFAQQLASNVHYVAEPVDKLAWLRSKRADSDSAEPFNVAQFYRNVDIFFGKYAPRARALRKARFRCTAAESREFRKFLFESKFYGGPEEDSAQQWDWLWAESFDALRYANDADGQRRRRHLLANMLVLLQPHSLQQSRTQVDCLNNVLRRATAQWTDKQVTVLESLLRATVYEERVSSDLAARKNCLVLALVRLVCDNNGSDVSLRAATLFLYTALRSQFDAVFCQSAHQSRDSDAEHNIVVANTFYRVVAALEREVDVESAVYNTFLSAPQLWQMAGMLIRYLREQAQADNTALDSMDFVQLFTAHVRKTVTDNLFASDIAFAESQVTNALINNI